MKYLGTAIKYKQGNEDRDMNEYMGKETRKYRTMKRKFIKKKQISTKTKITVFTTIFKLILTYGSETWICTRQMKSRIQATKHGTTTYQRVYKKGNYSNIHY